MQAIFEKLFKLKARYDPSEMQTAKIFCVFGVLFFLSAIIVIVCNSNITEIRIENYDSLCQKYNSVCTFKYQIKEMIPSPVYLYYELENFYQNHRLFVKSNSPNQLNGQQIQLDEAEKFCAPVVYNKNLLDWQLISYIDVDGPKPRTEPLDPDAIASPCGLIAKAFFNDTYNIEGVPINETGISLPGYQGQKFKASKDSETKQWINPENEHFIVWMTVAGISPFRKLWGRIEQDIKIGEYTFTVNNNYNPSTFGGAKNLILSNAGILGGKNTGLTVGFIIVCLLSFAIAGGFYYLSTKQKNN